MKRNFNHGYFLTRGIDKVGEEMGLTVLAYNIRRVLNILGVDGLIAAVKLKSNKIFNDLENKWQKTKKFFLQVDEYYLYRSNMYLIASGSHTV